MSKHETQMTRWYWEERKGTLVEEFCAVPRGPGQGCRRWVMLIARPTLVSSTSAPDCWATCATAKAIESSVRMPVMSSFLPSSSTSLPNLRTGGGIVAPPARPAAEGYALGAP